MVNGVTAKILYLGAWFCIFTCIVGIVILGVTNDPIPSELGAALLTLLGFIAGTHVKGQTGDPVRELRNGGNNE